MRSSIARKGMILAGVPLVFELVFIVALLILFYQAQSVSTRAMNSKLVIAETEAMLHVVWDGFQQAGQALVTQRRIDSAKLDLLTRKAVRKLDSMRSLAAGDVIQLRNIARLDEAFQGARKEVSSARKAMEEKQPWAGEIYARMLSRQYRNLRTMGDEITNRELKKQEKMPLTSGESLMLVNFGVLTGIIVNVLIALFLANFFARGITDRISAIVDNIQRMKEDQQLSAPTEGDNDEIAVLDREFHAMASSIIDARKKEQALVGNVRSVICSLNKELNFTKVSDEASRIWGQHDFLQINLSQLCHEKEWPDIESRFRVCKSSREMSMQMDIQMVPSTGVSVWMHWSVFWSREHMSFFCVAHDITQQKELQDLKRDFAQMISHDLRSPLQSVSAFFEILEWGLYGTLNERGISKVKNVNRTIGHLIRLINNLLDLEKLDAGMMELSIDSISLRTIVETSFELISDLAARRKLSVHIDIDAEMKIPLDQDKMIQVFQNLLGNAVKYSPVGGEIEVRSRQRGNYIEVEVIDNGQGIPIEEQDKIFDRFHQVKNAQGKQVAGTGLGLAFCKQIVDLHGGQIGVESTEGISTTFWIILPALSGLAAHAENS